MDQKIHPLTGKLVPSYDLEDMCLAHIGTGEKADVDISYHPSNAEYFDLVNARRFEK